MSVPSSHPKAFVSHASEDKDRFVLPFATLLRAKGIDAWVDKWEIKPGDSLVQKIFEDGVGRADAALIVLSPVSVTKPWVREELDSAFVAKVEGRIRLIPVIIEECDVPVALRHLSHLRVPNLSDFGPQAEQIARALFDNMVKPSLGATPVYASSHRVTVPGLTQSDSQVLLAIGELYLTRGRGPVTRDEIERALAPIGITRDLLVESLEMLEGAYYIEGKHAIGTKYFMVNLTSHGAEAAFSNLVPEFDQIERLVSSRLVNGSQTQCDACGIAEELTLPYTVVEHVLNNLSSRGLIKTAGHMRGMLVFEVSGRLRRALAE